MTSTTGQVTGQEWRITPEDREDGTTVYGLHPPGDTTAIMRCFPAEGFRVALLLDDEPRDLEFWHLMLPRRMTTLVESARIAEQVKARKLVDDGDHADSACSVCGRAPESYTPWASACQRKGCAGKYFPAKQNPAR